LTTLETVLIETPASRATSLMLAAMLTPRGPARQRTGPACRTPVAAIEGAAYVTIRFTVWVILTGIVLQR